MRKLPLAIRQAIQRLEDFIAAENQLRSAAGEGDELAEYRAAPLQAMRDLKAIQAHCEKP